MKTARLISRISLIVVFAFAALVACGPARTSSAVQLPDELIVVLGFAVMAITTGALKWLGARIGQDLSTQAKQVAAALASVIVLAINYAFTLVPAAYDNFLSAAFSFLIVWFGGMGLYSLWKAAAPVAPANR